MTIHERISERRKEKGYTQTSLAAKIGVHSSAVSQWEAGATPRPDVLARLAPALDVTTQWLQTGQSEPDSHAKTGPIDVVNQARGMIADAFGVPASWVQIAIRTGMTE